MNQLWDPPTEIQASGSRSAARRFGSIAERCSAARVRFAAADSAAPLPPALRSAMASDRDGRLRRKPEATHFLRLEQDENQMRVDKTS
jgi:hypothetical protein